MANPSLQIGNDNWAIKEDNLLGYSTAGTRFVPQPITMTRATLGTRVNPSGLVEDVALLGSELVTNGDFTTDTDWDKTGTWSIESNYATATANSTSQYIQQDFTITNGKTYLFTYEIIENTLNGVGSALSGSGGFVQIFLSNVIGTHQVYITADDSGAAYALKIGVSATATTGTIKLDNVSVKEATIDNLPRVDYTDGTSSLLVEPQRTNLITYSEDFSQWSSKINIDVTLNSETSPDGVVNATFINENNSNAQHFIGQSLSITNGQDISISVYAKKNQRDVLQISPSGNYLSPSGYANYDLNNGLVTASGGGVTAEIEGLTNGWFRCVAKFTANNTASGTTAFFLQNSTTASRGSSYDGDGTSGLYMWGAQTEIGSYATSYIPTSGSTVTRNQETYTKTGISDKINSTEGVLFAEIAALSDDGTSRLIGLSDGTSTKRINIYYDTSSNSIYGLLLNSSVQGITSFTLSDSTNFAKIAFKYKENDFALWVNGTEVDTDSSGTTFTSDTLNKLSFDRADGVAPFFGKVKQLQVFKTALSDTELATLTT